MTGIPSLPFKDPEALMRRLSDYHPVAMFVDVELQDNKSGLDLIHMLKSHWSTSPLIVVTSRQEGAVVRDALALGADDLVRKPLQKEELNARLQRLFQAYSASYQLGNTSFDPRFSTAASHEKSAQLQTKEQKLFEAMLSSPDYFVERAHLVQQVWGDKAISNNAVDRQIHGLRKVLATIGSNIRVRSIYGKGFQLELVDEQAPAEHSVSTNKTRRDVDGRFPLKIHDDMSSIDTGSFAALVQISPDDSAEFVSKLLQLFIENAVETHNFLASVQDLSRAKRAAHRLKGMASTIGANDLAEVLEEIESVNDSTPPEVLEALLLRERDAFELVCYDVRKILALNA